MRKLRERGATGVNLGLIVTPMLDMSFQILAFFIMTYHPSALEGQVTGNLAAREVFGNPIGEPDPVQLEEQVRDILTVTVSAGEAGRPGKVFLKSATEAVPTQVTQIDGNMPWSDAKRELARELKRRRKDDGAEKAEIKLAAAADLRQEYVLEVYDLCKNAGFTKIHFVPPPLKRPADR